MEFLKMLDRRGETLFNFAAARLLHRLDEFGDLINFRFGDRHGLTTASAAARFARNLFTFRFDRLNAHINKSVRHLLKNRQHSVWFDWVRRNSHLHFERSALDSQTNL